MQNFMPLPQVARYLEIDQDVLQSFKEYNQNNIN